MFEAYYTGMKEKLLPIEGYHPFPRISDRKAWQSLGKEYKEYIVSETKEKYTYELPSPPAIRYMDFYRDGNRSRYEHITFAERRLPLVYLTVAECLENKGRFIDNIIDAVWSTLEEASWVVPAHNNHFKPHSPEDSPLPNSAYDDSETFVDLFSAEAGALIAWVYYMLREKLDEQAPQVTERMLFELNRRIVKPFLENDDFGWMGLKGQKVNNWNPWICSNLLFIVSVACMDEDKRAAVVEKVFRCLENFVRGYAPDGGCDEGACYWGAAGGALFQCVEEVYTMTGGKVDFYKDLLIRNMCTFIYKMHIDGNYFVNYADADAKTGSSPMTIYHMGEAFGDAKMKKFAAMLYARNAQLHDPREMGSGKPQRSTKQIFDRKKLEKTPGVAPYVRDAYYPGIQVLVARSKAGTAEGLFFSAKGGTNAESHNHNDIGTFILYSDGKPAIMDMGRGVYEKKTFSAQRYEIPMMQSLYHNLPAVNGIGQMQGGDYKADRVDYKATAAKVNFSLGLEKAYPAEANIDRWDRSFVFEREQRTLTVTDDFALQQAGEICFTLMTAKKPTVKANVLTVKSDGRPLKVLFDERLQCSIESFDTSHDRTLRDTSGWGKQVYRVRFTVQGVQEGKFVMQIKQQ